MAESFRPWAEVTGIKPDRVSSSPDERVAHALEYIASQMGELNANLAKLINALDAKREDSQR